MPEERTDDDVIKLKIDDEMFELDMSDLELGEVGEVEDLCDSSVQDIDWDSARGTQGLVWIAMHRKNPRFTIADAGRVKVSSLKFGEPEPNGAAKKSPRPTKSA